MMHQGWKKLPLLVIVLLIWKNADGFKGKAYSNAHHRWGQPSDALSPHAQSSMSEAHVTGTLPVEVGYGLFPNKPLKSKSKFNVLQFVKGGSSSYQSTSHAQTAPGSSVSASLPLSPVQQPSSSLTSSGSTVSSVASGLSLETQYAASGSGPLISNQGERHSYSAELGVSGPSTSDGLHVSSSQGTSVHQSAEASLPVFSQESIPYSSSSAPGASSTSQGSPVLLSESLGQTVFSQGESSYSGLSRGASSQNTPDSITRLSSTISSQSTVNQSSPSLFSSSSQDSSGMLASGSYLAGLNPLVDLSSKSPVTSSQLLPLEVSSHSTSVQSSPSVSTSSTQSRSGTQLATSSGYVPVQGGSSSSFSLKPQGTLGQYAPASPTKYVSASMSSPQAVYSQTTSSGSSYRTVSQAGSRSQTGVSGQFTSQGGNYYSGLLPQSQATTSQYGLGYSKPISSPQRTSSQSASVLSSRKQYASASQGSAGAQFGASTGFASQGMSSSYSGSVQSQGTTGQFATGSSSPYDSLYCKCVRSPQGVDTRSIQSSRRQFTSSYGTQSGSSTFTLKGSITSDGSPQPQGTASQFTPVSHSYPSASSPSQGVASRSTTVQGSRKQLTSTFTSSSGTQAGSSTPSSLQGSSTYGGSPQPQDTASRFAPGPQSPYASVSMSSPQAVAGPSAVQSSRKQLPSIFGGSSGAHLGASIGFAPERVSSHYSGSVQSQDTAGTFVPGSKSPYASVSLSSPQARPSTIQGYRKQLPSTFTGSSGTQAGSSTRFTLLGSTAYGESSQPQDAASPSIPGSSSPYASVSLTSNTLGGQSSQSYQGYSVSQSQKSQRWQPSATRWTQGIRTSDAAAAAAAASQGSSSQSSPMRFSSLSSARGSSRVSDQFVSARGGSTSNDGSFQSQSLSTRYTPGSHLLPYDPSFAGQGKSSALASEVLSSYSSMNSQNAPAPSHSSSSSHFYSVKG